MVLGLGVLYVSWETGSAGLRERGGVGVVGWGVAGGLGLL